MKVGHGETEARVDFEAAVGCEHHNGWWFVWISLGKRHNAMIYSAFIQCVGWTSDGVVPFQYVILLWCCLDEFDRISHQAFVFLFQTINCLFGGHVVLCCIEW